VEEGDHSPLISSLGVYTSLTPKRNKKRRGRKKREEEKEEGNE